MSDKNKTINEKLAEFEQLVAWFEGDEFALEEALEKFAEAETLAKAIDKELEGFEHKINQLRQDFASS